MPYVDFSAYPYLPSLLTADVERMAYENLGNDAKETILPIFELSRRNGNESGSLDSSIEMASGITGTRPFLIDIDKRQAPAPRSIPNPANPAAEAARFLEETDWANSYNAELSTYISAENGFDNWCELVSQIPHAVPVLQFVDPDNQRLHIVEQAERLIGDGNCIALRIKQQLTTATLNLANFLLSELVTPDHLMIIIDCGQGRSRIDDKINFTTSTLESLLDGQAGGASDLHVTCMSNSFNRPGHDGYREVENLDWRIWEGTREIMPIAFGDYGANARDRSLSSWRPWSWRATVTHAHPRRWHIYRHPNAQDTQGWVEGAQVLFENGSFDHNGSWGDQLIEAAQNENLGDYTSPRFWHSGRVNGHLEVQAGYAATRVFDADGL